jgi:hypothetical protein
MLVGAAHVHFLEGERGPEEASLRFSEAFELMEDQGIKHVVTTFHLRHPADLRLATPAQFINLIEEYRGPIKISLMPEANIVYQRGSYPVKEPISSDISFWRRLDVDLQALERLISGWIVSAHFTTQLGWSTGSDNEKPVEATYEVMSQVYQGVMYQDWLGWVGHPFMYCSGDDLRNAMHLLLSAAVNTERFVEISLKSVGQKLLASPREAREWIPQYCPDVISRFSAYSLKSSAPLVVISLDAHHRGDLTVGIENARRVAQWLIHEGVRPEQIWGWEC